MKVYLNKLCAAILCMAIFFIPVQSFGSNENDSETTTLTMDGYTRVVDVGHNVTLVAKTMDIDPNSGRCYIFEGWTVDGVEPDNIRHSYEDISHTSGANDKPCDIFVDGIETFCFVGSYATFTAPHIKMDNNNDKMYIFNGWRAEGVELENPSSIRVSFIAPDNDVVLTPSYFRLGNVDNDAKESITALDIFAFLNGIKNGSTDKALDINLDGSVTAIDKLYLLKLIKGNFDYTELYYSLQFEGKEIQRVERVASKVGTEEIPFIAVLQAAGATIEWDTETVASVKYNNKSYTLNISECLMYDNNNQSFNMISGVPGAYVTHTVAEKELYLEQTMVKVALKRVFGINYLVSIDHEERIIKICQ